MITATLPVLALLAGGAFLAESRRFLFTGNSSWREAAPWVAVWLAVSLYVPGQPAVREFFQIELLVNGQEIERVYWLAHVNYWSFFTAYWSLAWVVSRQSSSSRAVIVSVVVVMALFQSLYGTLAIVKNQEMILGLWPRHQSTPLSVSGTFYNRNHLAGLLAVSIPLGTAYLLARSRSGIRGRIGAVKAAAVVLCLLITGAALIGTASRLGIFAALVGILLWGWLYTQSEYDNSRLKYVSGALLVLLPILAGLWFGPDRLIERLFSLDEALGETGRPAIWRAMLDTPFAVWVQGIGAGSFHDVFKLIQPVTRGSSVWRAHSDHLQFVFEFGLIGIFVLAPVVSYWIVKCRPARLDSLQRGVFAGVVAIMIHNVGDIDMQIPGTAIMFWIALGILMSGARQETRQ